MPLVVAWSTVLLLAAMLAGTLTPPVAAESSAAASATEQPAVHGVRTCRVGAVFTRTELFFGRAMPGGGVVPESAWQDFLEQEITPRFPDGLTILRGLGQFKGPSGVMDHEDMLLVIILYPVDAAGGNERIEEIRALYKRTFQQQSVLRVETTVCASF